MKIHDDVEIGDLGQAILVLKLMRKDMADLTDAVKDMSAAVATTPQLERVRSELHTQITVVQEDLHAKLSALKVEVKSQSAGSSLDRFLTVITRIGAAVMVWTAVVGLVVGAVRYVDTRAPITAQQGGRP